MKNDRGFQKYNEEKKKRKKNPPRIIFRRPCPLPSFAKRTEVPVALVRVNSTARPYNMTTSHDQTVIRRFCDLINGPYRIYYMYVFRFFFFHFITTARFSFILPSPSSTYNMYMHSLVVTRRSAYCKLFDYKTTIPRHVMLRCFIFTPFIDIPVEWCWARGLTGVVFDFQRTSPRRPSAPRPVEYSRFTAGRAVTVWYYYCYRVQYAWRFSFICFFPLFFPSLNFNGITTTHAFSLSCRFPYYTMYYIYL